MADTAERRHLDILIERCYAGLDATSLRLEMLRRLRSLLTVDAAFFATVDPVTMLFTSAVTEEPLTGSTQLFIENEFGEADVNRFADLARDGDSIGSLDRATRGERTRSPRFTGIMAPLQLGDELRMVLQCSGRSWGVLCLHRGAARAGFDDRDVAILRAAAPHLAEGLRRAQLVSVLDDATGKAAGQTTSRMARDTGPGTGMIVLDTDLRVRSINDDAERWLAELSETDWPRSSALPLAVHAAARRLDQRDPPRGAEQPPAEVKLRTARGRWLRVHASRLRDATDADSVGGSPPVDQIAVIIEPVSPVELGSVLLAAHGLTRAQERVAALVLQGRSTRQVVDELHISAHTVQEHLTAVFDKLGVRSRRELVAVLLERH